MAQAGADGGLLKIFILYSLSLALYSKSLHSFRMCNSVVAETLTSIDGYVRKLGIGL